MRNGNEGYRFDGARFGAWTGDGNPHHGAFPEFPGLRVADNAQVPNREHINM